MTDIEGYIEALSSPTIFYRRNTALLDRRALRSRHGGSPRQCRHRASRRPFHPLSFFSSFSTHSTASRAVVPTVERTEQGISRVDVSSPQINIDFFDSLDLFDGFEGVQHSSRGFGFEHRRGYSRGRMASGGFSFSSPTIIFKTSDRRLATPAPFPAVPHSQHIHPAPPPSDLHPLTPRRSTLPSLFATDTLAWHIHQPTHKPPKTPPQKKSNFSKIPR